MSYRSSAIRIGGLAIVLAAGVAPLSAQGRQLSPEIRARIQKARTPIPVIQPRSYTSATFQARLVSLHGGAALLASVQQNPRLTAATQHAAAVAPPVHGSQPVSTPAHSSEPVPTPPPPQPNTTWNTGIGAIGAVTTISAAKVGQWDSNACLYFDVSTIYPQPGQVMLVQGTAVEDVYFIPGDGTYPGIGTVTYAVLFDFPAGSAYPSSITIRGQSDGNVNGVLATCTAADLQASTSGNVVTCPLTFSGAFDDLTLTVTPSEPNGATLLDVSFMRMR